MQKEMVIDEIVIFYQVNNLNFDIALSFQLLLKTTGLSSDGLDEILRLFDDQGFLKDICWADEIAFEFSLSKLGQKEFGLI